MSAAIPPLPSTPSLCGAQLNKKHRDNFTCYLYFYCTLKTSSLLDVKKNGKASAF